MRHYKTPILLIEFDPARAFSLQSSSDLGDDIDPRATMSRLVLLILHFPKMRCEDRPLMKNDIEVCVAAYADTRRGFLSRRVWWARYQMHHAS